MVGLPVLVGLLLGSCSAAPATPTGATPPPPQVSVSQSDANLEASFGDEVGLTLEAGASIEVAGSASPNVDVIVVTKGSGHIRTVPGFNGQGAALRFPDPDGGSAALEVKPRSGDDLTPGTARFEYGADFMADGDWDDGDNVIQRGLYTDRGQYKLEIDGGRPACSMKGSAGQLTVRLGPEIESQVWYRARCVRDGGQVALSVLRIGTGETWTRTIKGPTGNIRPQSPFTQMSIGAKTWDNGHVGEAPDQFSGVIDNVFLRIG